MFQILPVTNFKWIEDTSEFSEDFIKNYDEESDEGYFHEVDVQYYEKLHEGYFHEVDVQYYEKLHELNGNLPFLPERISIEKVKKVLVNLHHKNLNKN